MANRLMAVTCTALQDVCVFESDAYGTVLLLDGETPDAQSRSGTSRVGAIDSRVNAYLSHIIASARLLPGSAPATSCIDSIPYPF